MDHSTIEKLNQSPLRLLLTGIELERIPLNHER